tara:strand:+ start:677 stop:790 length:114 start_codon:yes stop_codon:yes gene_type:complete
MEIGGAKAGIHHARHQLARMKMFANMNDGGFVGLQWP